MKFYKKLLDFSIILYINSIFWKYKVTICQNHFQCQNDCYINILKEKDALVVIFIGEGERKRWWYLRDDIKKRTLQR